MPQNKSPQDELRNRLTNIDSSAMAASISHVEDIDEDDDEQHEKHIRRLSREDDYSIERTLKDGLRLAIKTIALCMTLGVLIAFGMGFFLLFNYILDISSDSHKTATVLKKLFEWAGVLFSGLFLQGTFKKVLQKNGD